MIAFILQGPAGNGDCHPHPGQRHLGHETQRHRLGEPDKEEAQEQRQEQGPVAGGDPRPLRLSRAAAIRLGPYPFAAACGIPYAHAHDVDLMRTLNNVRA